VLITRWKNARAAALFRLAAMLDVDDPPVLVDRAMKVAPPALTYIPSIHQRSPIAAGKATPLPPATSRAEAVGHGRALGLI